MRAALVCALALCLGWPAHAEPANDLPQAERVQRAKAHFQIGIRHFNLGDYEAAMADFEKGYAYQPLPLLLYNAGQAALRAGKPEAALDLFHRFLAAAPEAPERKEVERLIGECKRKIAERPPAPPPPPRPEPVVVTPPPVKPAPVEPAPVVTPPAPVVIVAPAPRPPARSRLLPHVWLWPTVAAAAGIALGVGLSVGLAQHPNYPGSDLGTISFVP